MPVLPKADDSQFMYDRESEALARRHEKPAIRSLAEKTVGTLTELVDAKFEVCDVSTSLVAVKVRIGL